MLKRILTVAAVCSAALLTGCAGTAEGNGQNAASNPAGAAEHGDVHMQLAPPAEGDTMVTLHTNMGDITIRMFPEEAPRAYENFVTHARNGYYDGVIFHRVLEDFMIQGGDPTGTGGGGESIWGESFEPEFSLNLRHFRGALAMAQPAYPNAVIGSQFYIVQNSDDLTSFYDSIVEDENIAALFPLELEEGTTISLDDAFPPAKRAAYALGGTPHLDMIMFRIGLLPRERGPGHTVLGQVWEGMDVVDAIAAVEVDDPMQGRPVEDVVIESTTVFVYGE